MGLHPTILKDWAEEFEERAQRTERQIKVAEARGETRVLAVLRPVPERERKTARLLRQVLDVKLGKVK